MYFLFAPWRPRKSKSADSDTLNFLTRAGAWPRCRPGSPRRSIFTHLAPQLCRTYPSFSGFVTGLFVSCNFPDTTSARRASWFLATNIYRTYWKMIQPAVFYTTRPLRKNKAWDLSDLDRTKLQLVASNASPKMALLDLEQCNTLVYQQLCLTMILWSLNPSMYV